MNDLVFYFPCNESHVFRFPLSILSVFFDLVRKYMSTGAGEACWKWSGGSVFGQWGLSWTGDFILILNDLMEGVPEVCDGFVFGRHGENLFELAI